MAQGDEDGSEAATAAGDEGAVGQTVAGAVGQSRRLARLRKRKGSAPRPLTDDDNHWKRHAAEWEGARARIYTLAQGLAEATGKVHTLTSVGVDPSPVKYPAVPTVGGQVDMNLPDPDQLALLRAKLETYLEHLELVEDELREFRVQQLEKALL